jgi:hypothetical protein
LAAIVATRPFSVHKRVAWTGGFRNPGAPRSSVDAATGARAPRRRLGRRRRRRSFARRGGPAEGARGPASVPPGAVAPRSPRRLFAATQKRSSRWGHVPAAAPISRRGRAWGCRSRR